MNRIAMAALLPLLAAGCGYSYSSTSVTIGGNQVTRKAPVQIVPAGKSPAITVDNPVGAVTLKAGDEGPLLVEAELRASTEADLDRIKIAVTSEDGKVKVGWTAEGSRENLSVTFTITAPRASTLRVDTALGSVEARGFTNGIVAHTGGGSITTAGVSGELRLDSGLGSVEVSDAKGKVVAATGGGSITVADAAGDLDLDSKLGSITVRRGSGKVDARSGGGKVSVFGRAGDSTLKSALGSIEVAGALGAVIAKSGGGSVDVEGRLSGACSIRSDLGSVTATLPADSSLVVEGSSALGSVETDFPLAVEGKTSPRTVKGTLGDGKGGTLRIETGGGSLNLRKK